MLGTPSGALIVVFNTTSTPTPQFRKSPQGSDEFKDDKAQVCRYPLENEGKCLKICVCSDLLWK